MEKSMKQFSIFNFLLNNFFFVFSLTIDLNKFVKILLSLYILTNIQNKSCIFKNLTEKKERKRNQK